MKRASDTVAPTMHGAPLPTYALGAQLFWAGQFTLPASYCRGVSYSPPGSSWVTSYWSGEAGSGGSVLGSFPNGADQQGRGNWPKDSGYGRWTCVHGRASRSCHWRFPSGAALELPPSYMEDDGEKSRDPEVGPWSASLPVQLLPSRVTLGKLLPLSGPALATSPCTSSSL